MIISHQLVMTDAWVVYYYRQCVGIGRVHRLFARVGASLDLFLEVGLLRRREHVCNFERYSQIPLPGGLEKELFCNLNLYQFKFHIISSHKDNK